MYVNCARIDPRGAIARRWTAVAVLAVLLAAPQRVRCAEPDAPAGVAAARVYEDRVYEDGPLTKDDFQAEVPVGDRTLDAFTTSELRFQYQYQTRSSARRVTAWTTHIQVEAVVMPAQSWNSAVDNSRLLDHEQGHFDITQIGALRARLHFARDPRLSSVAASGELALANLRDQIQRQIDEIQEVVLAEHHRYDRATRHGRDRGAQEEHRRQHREQIRSLSSKLDELQPLDAPRSSSPAVR